MRGLLMLTVVGAVALSVAVAQAQMVLYDDFESYIRDSSIHLQGIDTVGVPRWYAQQNNSMLGDSGLANVRRIDGNGFLELAADEQEGFVSTSNSTAGAAMAMTSREITGEGTIYLWYAVNDVSSNMLCTNDLNPGWDYTGAGVPPAEIGTNGWQEGYSGEGYSAMGAMVKTGGGINFNARNGGGYTDDVAPTMLPVGVWMELWMQIDAPNHVASYWICPLGGVPVQMINPGPDGIAGNADDSVWWSNRDQAHVNNSVANLKFIVSNWGYTDEVSNTLYIDNICINTSAMTLERIPYPPCLSCPVLGDLDGDRDVDLDDFIILKNAFGVDDTGDIDGDGDTDLDDFVLLKSNFGA